MENKRIIMEVPYFQVPNDIFEIGLDKHELLVYMYLARYGNQGNTSFPSYNKIAEKTGMSRRKAIDCVKSLEKKKLLIKEKRYNYERQENYSNIYRVEHNVKDICGAHNALGGEYSALCGEEGAPYKEIDYKELGYKEPINNHLHNPLDCDGYCYLSEIDNEFVQSYLAIMRPYRPTHKRVKKENIDYILNAIELIRGSGFELPDWEQAVHEYFTQLPSSNDGDIIAFLSASMRYFNVDVNFELGR